MEVHGQVDVDEQVAAPVERRAHPVASIGRDQKPLQRRGLLAGDQRDVHPQPDGGRPGLNEGSLDKPVVHRRVVADVVAGLEELAGGGLVRAGRRIREPRGTVELDVLGAKPPALSADQRLAVPAREDRGHKLDPPPRPDHLRLDPDRSDRHRTEDLVGDPGDLGRRPLAAIHAAAAEPLHRTGDQRRRRAGMLGAGVPGAAGRLSGGEALAVALVEGVGHGGILGRASSNAGPAWRTKH